MLLNFNMAERCFVGAFGFNDTRSTQGARSKSDSRDLIPGSINRSSLHQTAECDAADTASRRRRLPSVLELGLVISIQLARRSPTVWSSDQTVNKVKMAAQEQPLRRPPERAAAPESRAII